MDELKTTLQQDFIESQSDLDYVDYIEDQNTYLDSIDDMDDINAILEGYLLY